MALRILCAAERGAGTGVPQYWERLIASLAAVGLDCQWTPPGAWTGNAATDLSIVDNQDALLVPDGHAVIAVQHGCAMEHGLRIGSTDRINLGRRQFAAARRSRTFWVSCSAWAAHHCERHTGAHAMRIIPGAVDVERFFPSERHRVRNAHIPVILHHCADPNKGSNIIGAVAEALGGAFAVSKLEATPVGVPEAMRQADMWLCLSASEGLPTVVQEALATNLLVVGPNVGVLWPYQQGEPLEARDAGAAAWLNQEVGAVVFDWQWRREPRYIADWVWETWRQRGKLNGRDYALRWFSHELFAQKWLEAIECAAKTLDVGAEIVPQVQAARQVEHGVRA